MVTQSHSRGTLQTREQRLTNYRAEPWTRRAQFHTLKTHLFHPSEEIEGWHPQVAGESEAAQEAVSED